MRKRERGGAKALWKAREPGRAAPRNARRGASTYNHQLRPLAHALDPRPRRTHAHAGHLVQNAGLARRAGSSDPFTLNDSSFTSLGLPPPEPQSRRRWSTIQGQRSRDIVLA